MKTRTRTAWRSLLVLLSTLLFSATSWAQGSIPFTIANNSPFPDTDLYVAIVGIDPAGNHVWINAANSQVLPMSSSYNTVTGPTYNGNTGPGANSKYAACFTRLSSIPNKTFTLPYIAGCRVFISRGQQLYLYFFGASGAPSGYAAPNAQNPNDPNRGIMYEFIELTNNQYGFFGNTTRVDAFRYPMGLELFGNGYQKRTGELKSAADIVAAYKANVPTEFQGTVNSTTGEITFPSKTPAFQDGSNGTVAGPYGQYFKSYIDAIWNKYKTTDLIFYAGNAGVFKGRVDANDRLVVVGQNGAFAGRTGIINGRPTTQMAFEGKGLLDNRVSDGDCDLVVQAQMTAAINRHVVDVTTATPGQQNWYDASKYYQAGPANYYARFWHLPGISVDNLSYGFAYDDVNDQSATLQTAQPTKVIATFGGFAGSTPPPVSGVATVYKDCNYTGTAVNLPAGDYTLSALQSRGILNDDISSLKVNTGYEVVLYENDNFAGAALTVGSAGNGCLVNNPLGTGNWNDKATSVRVRTATSSTFSVTLQAEAANVNNGMTVETTTDAGGGQNMGYVDAGDYLVWNGINFPTTGTYTIEYRVASGASGGTISSDLNAGAIQFGNSAIPATGGWQTWTTVSKTVTINAGTYNFGIYAQTGGWNINWVRITKAGAARPALATSAQSNSEALQLYPNPAADKLYLNSDTPLAGSQYRILDISGRTMSSGALESNTVEVAKLSAGIYTLLVITPDQQQILRRFVKSK
ncbi:beta-1,3-glucanase family protein [Hymenobacter chitinivorans]|uniref:Putative secreted protein (Por secretion system target) n=1 Tax=Hymenobacter chitinivorans DSM 11115 TaxID=1121954 RepID=A0A2M9B5A9_9BACT|nr:beta-1,3-glucanase family protein [Hymenobacter chitinivorans]PJJ53131.1 putative secreted protein (Por secretion system target) [Hymenobacter chitinivorans DSM 11115]